MILRGSSPRVWGYLPSNPLHKGNGRVVPARVGISLIVLGLNPYRDRRPRAGGDISDPGKMCRNTEGSSPRVWGYLQGSRGRLSPDRVVPARVGISRSGANVADRAESRPRACGDISLTAGGAVQGLESSPRVWGYLYVLRGEFEGVLVVPARVGISRSGANVADRAESRPRAYGDIPIPRLSEKENDQSSPRVWGYLWYSKDGSIESGLSEIARNHPDSDVEDALGYMITKELYDKDLKASAEQIPQQLYTEPKQRQTATAKPPVCLFHALMRLLYLFSNYIPNWSETE